MFTYIINSLLFLGKSKTVPLLWVYENMTSTSINAILKFCSFINLLPYSLIIRDKFRYKNSIIIDIGMILSIEFVFILRGENVNFKWKIDCEYNLIQIGWNYKISVFYMLLIHRSPFLWWRYCFGGIATIVLRDRVVR